ncbi:neutral zinc metallopeptidase [Phytophthora cinnamomi]|uniref:neutral zinc metallopeptidase n=1 Tax=Phytophthora cinnamomi TaxID=4785 RepID=UPI003559DD28|nr:neutral zinc metallopeptidase [Phytophthora cinnamomi]
MASSAQPSPFSIKHLLLTALVAFVGSGAEAAGVAGNHATFGKITSGSGKCITGDPTTYVTRQDVNWQGKLSYCVRWDSKSRKLTKAVASKFQAMLEKQMNLWNRWLAGYECWPYDKISISVVGFAVYNKSSLDWSDDSLGTIYEGILDGAGSPQCPDECYKHLGQAASADTSGCKGQPFDMSLWPSEVHGADDISPTIKAGCDGAGGDWGQRVSVGDMLDNMDQEQMTVLLHEMGHGFGLPEMYVDENKPASFPACIMDESETLTDGDGWLLRSVLENIKSRYNF